MDIRMVHWLIMAQVALGASRVLAGDPLSYENMTHLAPSDYLWKSQQSGSDKLFDQARVIDLGAELGIGSDCGKVDFRSTLRSTLGNILDSKYFGDMGRDIVAGSPMLMACYFSPTWCAVLKHSQLSANFLSQMRLNQCQIIDKYTDSRVEDFERERQSCVREHIKNKGGDLESAMESCQNVWNADLVNWAGSKNGKDSKVSTNELIESSAKWAGFNGEDARRSLDLTKSIVGDTVVSRGRIAVDYGPRGRPATPATHLEELQTRFQKTLCHDLLPRVRAATGNTDRLTTEDELRKLSGSGDPALLDRQTIEALAMMPRNEREIACRRLSNSMGLAVFAKDLQRSLDMLTAAAQNPNLPPNRRAEIEEKRRVLKESVDLTLSLGRERDGQLSQVEAQINEAGDRHKAARAASAVSSDIGEEQLQSAKFNLMDCADGVMCGGQ